jgi:hypothetical protein
MLPYYVGNKNSIMLVSNMPNWIDALFDLEANTNDLLLLSDHVSVESKAL